MDGSFVPTRWCRGDGALAVVNVREGRTRPLAALRVRFAQATRRLRRGRILRVRCFDAVFGRAGARPSRSGNFIEIALPNPQMNQYLNAIVNRKIVNES